jgi:hypothetical protein
LRIDTVTITASIGAGMSYAGYLYSWNNLNLKNGGSMPEDIDKVIEIMAQRKHLSKKLEIHRSIVTDIEKKLWDLKLICPHPKDKMSQSSCGSMCMICGVCGMVRIKYE